MQKKAINNLVDGKIKITIFNDGYLVSLLMGLIVCGIALLYLLVTIGTLYM
jgi:hypothetical protein